MQELDEAAAELGCRLAAAGPALSRADAVRLLQVIFSGAGIDSPGLDARFLVAATLGIDQAGLIATGEGILSTDERQALLVKALRRLRREPVSRIVGKRWFRGLELEVGSATLDPRPETETLVDGVLSALGQAGDTRADALDGVVTGPIRVLDLGTGTGAILITLLVALPRATGLGIDISQGALDIAAANARRHGVADRVGLRCSDWLAGLKAGEVFDVVVANPPYIARGDIPGLDPEVRLHDPSAALDGGEDGLDAFREIFADVGNHLACNGLLVCEVGAGQAGEVERLGVSAGLAADGCPQRWRDLSGHIRCVAFRARTPAVVKKVLGARSQPG